MKWYRSITKTPEGIERRGATPNCSSSHSAAKNINMHKTGIKQRILKISKINFLKNNLTIQYTYIIASIAPHINKMVTFRFTFTTFTFLNHIFTMLKSTQKTIINFCSKSKISYFQIYQKTPQIWYKERRKNIYILVKIFMKLNQHFKSKNSHENQIFQNWQPDKRSRSLENFHKKSPSLEALNLRKSLKMAKSIYIFIIDHMRQLKPNKLSHKLNILPNFENTWVLLDRNPQKGRQNNITPL